MPTIQKSNSNRAYPQTSAATRKTPQSKSTSAAVPSPQVGADQVTLSVNAAADQVTLPVNAAADQVTLSVNAAADNKSTMSSMKMMRLQLDADARKNARMMKEIEARKAWPSPMERLQEASQKKARKSKAYREKIMAMMAKHQ